MRRKALLFPLVTLFSALLLAQEFDALKFRNVGPLRGGRVTAVAGSVAEPGTFYFGATGGGVWKTMDYGTTWENTSDGFFKTPSIGSISVYQKDPKVIYVGTGSDGLRSNVIAGKGVYKSIDGGENWQHIGLENVGQIGAVEIHPDNFNIVYVAAIGNAFAPNSERGIYKTTDGGKTWSKILFISDKVGFSDLELHPTNPEILYATAWKAERKPWTIISGGTFSEGGIYKSLDGGKSWNKASSGLPQDLIGKIDLAVCPADSRIVYALVEAPEKAGGLYKSVDQGESYTQVSSHEGIRTRPFYYTNIEVDPTNPDILYALATGYFKSTDGGKSWQRKNSPHGDNHDIWIHPENPALFIQSNDGGANVTFNGGETWSTQFNQPTAEIYQVEVDNQYPYWLYGGQQDNYSTIAVPSNLPYGIQAGSVGYIINTGGCETGPAVPHPENPNIVYSNCKGRFTVYYKENGMEKAYYVGANYMYGHNPKELEYRFQRVSPIHISPHDPNVIYHTSQFVHRTTDEGVTWETISPDLTAFEEDKQVISGSPITRDITGEEYYSTIYSIRESPIKKGVIWTGSNDGLVYVTKDNGKNWMNVTPVKLPSGGRVDAVEPSYHQEGKAIVSVLRYQLGDWKPYIYKTEDYGEKWTLISENNGIPADFPVRVVREDPERKGLLFAGTEYGLFVSFDDGDSWQEFQLNLPVTPITDIKIHRNDLVLSTMGRGFWILDNVSLLREHTEATQKITFYTPGTSMRYRNPSVWIRSDVPDYERPGVLFDYYLGEKAKEPLLLTIKDGSGNIVNSYVSDTSSIKFKEEIKRNMSTNEFTYTVNDNLTNNKGYNRFRWDMTYPGPWHKNENRRYKNGPMVAPGKYEAQLILGSDTLSRSFKLIMNPSVRATYEDINEQINLELKTVDLISQLNKKEKELEDELRDLKKDKEQNQNRISTLENILSKLQSKDEIYPKPMLIDQVNYLYYMITGADQKPGKDALERFEELSSEFQEIMASL